ncbi:hypothetical protein ACFXI6_51320 [Streptomyces mirabilis]|uniref:hypothetical protein n=1 Tax=Streptomyces mirabilis TaxID=68239 RepID=UPI00368E3902
MTDAPASDPFDFPSDLIKAQKDAADAHAKLRRFQASLPWSREPHDGWEAPEPAHGGVLHGYQSSRPATKGWTQAETDEYARLWEQWRETAARVYTHRYWHNHRGEDAIKARQALKHEPGAQPVLEVEASKPGQDDFAATG